MLAVIRQNNGDRTDSLGVRGLVVSCGMAAAGTAVGMDLAEAGQPVGTKMLSRLTHGGRSDVVVPGMQLCIRNRDRGYHFLVTDAKAVEIGDPLHRVVQASELIQQSLPKKIRNRDHRLVLGNLAQ